jgi:hypothetical protein
MKIMHRHSVKPQKNGVFRYTFTKSAYFIIQFWKPASGVLDERRSYVTDYGNGNWWSTLTVHVELA